MKIYNIAIGITAATFTLAACMSSESERVTDYVNPLLGTATLWDPDDLGYERHQATRTWGAEVFPGAALPNAMVQLTPQTMWHAGAGYQYEDSTILGFAHSAMGHWNLMELPILPVTENFTADDYASGFSHDNESARPGYYRVYLDRYGVDAELTSTLRAGYHRYSFGKDDARRLLVNVAHAQGPVRDWAIDKVADNAFAGHQGGFHYYAVTSQPIDSIALLPSSRENGVPVAVVDFMDNKSPEPLEVKIGVSYVSIENARLNLETEILDKDFATVYAEADEAWEKLLSKIKV
ncbi:MAG: glycoside hydrolase family 92 protein, partial [Muribaculaceae bacterium]|nr:glycoside hydrolase family 92 protein [Muribaculaceae bacterium]